MKRYNKSKFTLIELMFVVAILVILIGISWVAGTKVLRNQAKSKTKAELVMIVAAVKQYKELYGSFPPSANHSTDLNFAEYLSKVQPNTTGWTGKRPMFIDYKKNNINYTCVANEVYDLNAGATTLFDPYENEYIFIYNELEPSKFLIYSVGLDGEHEEPAPTTVGDYDKDHTDNADNITSDDL